MAFALSKEELAVLDDAVAFVAAWDNSTDEMATDSDPSLSPSDSSDRPTESPLPVTPTKTPSHRKRISNRTTMKHANTRGAHEAAGPQRPPPPKTRVAELIELRQQVVELETRLARLQKRRGSRTTEPRRFAAPRNESGRTRVLDSQKHDHNAPPSEHRNDAVMALEQLQQSETLNLKLKRAVETHEKISKRIESIFLKQTMNRDLAYLLEMERRLPREYMPSDRDVREEARIVQDLYHTLNANFYKTASMMASISAQDMRRVFSTSGLKQTRCTAECLSV
uniref:Uncharacterized protein n=1 Tax=Globisporangium ultimum (strain ATCC 200006 / CBS 805.95 / DAOM BR144) TaxID=431595 RepID=K3XDI0_GLOUD